ncbi:MAG: OsmC family protein [Methylococcaceae bacterium]|nr:OsmC family protein [Methylococcaceae bacterium]
MTLRMYAEMKGLPLARVRVRLSHRKIHAEDCSDCETQEGKVDEIIREITLEGDLSDEERTRLLEIANRCPVHRTLSAEIKVVSKIGFEVTKTDRIACGCPRCGTDRPTACGAR